MNPGQTISADKRAAARPSSQGQLLLLTAEAAECERCPLFRNATQIVFGEGPADARIMLIGEQPGDQEDRTGRPFAGPAGRVLDKALQEIGLDRRSVYVTNAVKHFKFERRGKRRLHKHPSRYEIERCRWWLEREFAVIEPQFVIALGVLAASALKGSPVTLARERGRLLHWSDGRAGIATIHPSAVLRMPDDAARSQAFEGFVKDLRMALMFVEKLGAPSG